MIYSYFKEVHISKHHFDNNKNDEIMKIKTPTLFDLYQNNLVKNTKINCVFQKGYMETKNDIVQMMEKMSLYQLKELRCISLIPSCVNGNNDCYIGITNIGTKLLNVQISLEEIRTLVNEFNYAYASLEDSMNEFGLKGQMTDDGVLLSVDTQITVDGQLITTSVSEALNAFYTYQNTVMASRIEAQVLSEQYGIEIDYDALVKNANWQAVSDMEIKQPEESVTGDKYLVLLQKTDANNNIETDLQVLECYDKETQAVAMEKVPVRTTSILPVTGEQLEVYVFLGIVIVLIVLVVIRIVFLMRKNKNENK